MHNLISKWIFSIVLYFSICLFALATEFSEFKKIATETIKQVKGGEIKNIDELIEMQSTLIHIGKAASKNYGATNPKSAKMMKLVVAQAETMKTLSLSQIETQWHEKTYLKGKGIPESLLSDKSKPGNYMDAVVRPATTYILLSEFKRTKDKNLLIQVVDELEQVLHHVDSLN